MFQYSYHSRLSGLTPLVLAFTLAFNNAHAAPDHNAPETDAALEGETREQPATLSQITIEGREMPSDLERKIIDPQRTVLTAPDSATLMQRVPGGNISNNGPISSQVQYRGMFGPRMNVLIDGMHMNQGGPNWMDPPLHYIPYPLLDRIEVDRGIASVSSGGQTIGGTVRGYSKTSRYANSNDFELHGSLQGSLRTVDDSFGAGGIVSMSNRNHRLHIVGSAEDGDDIDFGDGTIAASSHERQHFGLGYGFRSGDHEFSFDYRHTDTDNTGTPALPMDIAFFDTDMVKGAYRGDWQGFQIHAMLHYSSIDHGMNNFELRPAPDFNPMSAGPDRRFVIADAENFGYRLFASIMALGGDFNFGVDGELSNHNMIVRDPDAAGFFVNQFQGVDQNRYGFFAEWNGRLNQLLSAEFGIRYNRVEMSAGAVDSAPSRMLPPPMRLRDQFNAADRNISDNNLDWVSKFYIDATGQLRFELGAARKTRSPSYIERFLWLPLEVTAGLADGNNYVGNLELDPEVSHEFEFGFGWTGDNLTLSPRIFYKTVDDFIQGTATDLIDVIRVSTLNGDSTPLQFNNVEAEYFGFDIEVNYRFNANWHADAILSYVRGDRRDINDPLYRIAPPNGVFSLTYENDRWNATAELVAYADGDRVSQEIVGNEPRTDNTDTDGYAILNLYGSWQMTNGLRLAAGIENLFDNDYISHLNGFNRVMGSDVAVGQRLPGAGQNWFIRTSYTF
ncbi:MAG: TonB-dependent copper receptor [Wenzhouxiangellaceae bacterium]